MYDQKVPITELNAALTSLGIAPTDETREKLRSILDRVWRSGYQMGHFGRARRKSPYREER